MLTTAKLAASMLVLLASVVGAASVRAETVNCTPITTLPRAITVAGVYCFTGNLATAITAGSAINIQTDSVVLDLNGFKLSGLAAGPGTRAVGIFAFNLQNITIKNGTILGFSEGILLANSGGSHGHVVEDIRADQNTWVGIDVDGTGIIIRNNQVVETRGSTVFGPNADAFGIVAGGNGPRVLNNDVITTNKQGGGVSIGIVFRPDTQGGLAVNNRITGQTDVGIAYVTPATGKIRDNLTFGVTSPFQGGTDAGNNN